MDARNKLLEATAYRPVLSSDIRHKESVETNLHQTWNKIKAITGSPLQQ